MGNYWLAVGTVENWQEAFHKGNIWGLQEKKRSQWEQVQLNDIVFFYVMRPVAGVIGYGTIKTKFRQTQPLWVDEIKKGKALWPLRFEINVEYSLPPDKWAAGKVTSEILRFQANLSFRKINAALAEEIIPKLKAKEDIAEEEPVSHKEMKEKLMEIGKLQNYIAEGEYSFDIGRLDVVWRRVEQSVPTYVFEVNVRGDIYHDLAKLKHAFDLWNSHIFIVASHEEQEKVEGLLSGTFHEIAQHLRFIDLDTVKELHRRKRDFIELEKKLGI